jgi:hypothetical protein
MMVKNKNEFSLLKREIRRECPFGNHLGDNTPTAVIPGTEKKKTFGKE